MGRLSEESIVYSSAALQAGDVKEALAVRNREFNQLSGRGDENSGRVMELILGNTPTLLADCPPEVLEPLRVVAAMKELWGESSIRRFVTVEGELDYRFGIEAIVNMLYLHSSYLRQLENLRDVGATGIKLLGSGNPGTCSACQAADGKVFPIANAPELPLVDCTCTYKYGCIVIMVPVSLKPREPAA